MSGSDTLLLGVVYPGVEKYLPEYLASVRSQQDCTFDLLLLNDRGSAEIPRDLPAGAIIIDVEGSRTPAEIRLEGITYAVDNGYEHLVFSDTDDYFSSNRVRASIDGLRKYDFVYNKVLTVTGGDDPPPTAFLPQEGLPERISWREVVDKNFFGLTHTAVTVKSLDDLYIPKEIIAVDWWIFTILLLRGCRGGYVKDAVTYYRQSDDNTVGMGRLLTEERLKLGIEAKTLHYENLVSYCSRNGLRNEEEVFKGKLGEMEELKARVEDAEFRERYLGTINKNFKEIFTGWWSEILPIEEWENYA